MGRGYIGVFYLGINKYCVACKKIYEKILAERREQSLQSRLWEGHTEFSSVTLTFLFRKLSH